jgi:hypothetical protein
MAMKITEQQQQGLANARAERNPPATQPVRPREKPSTTALTKPLTKLTVKPGEFGQFKSATVFQHPNDSVLMDVFNRNGLYLETLPVVDYGVSGTTLSIDVEKALQSNNYIAGQFTIGLKATRNFLGSYNGPKLQIQEISNDRLEVRVVPASVDPFSTELTDTDVAFQDFFANGFFQLDKLSTLSNLKLNWSLQDAVGVFDYVQDRFTYQAVPYSVIFKLIEPIPSTLSIDDFVWISQDVSETINEDVIVYPPIPKSSKTYIAGPNFDVNAKKGFQQSTEYKNWDTILNYASASITTTLLSQSKNEGVELNVDYTRFENFIHFGSAYARISNFYDKVKVLEYYQDIVDSISTDLSGLAQSSISSSNYYILQKDNYLNKIETVKGAFDGFEKYMYYQSSSYVSNSFGEFLDMAYPKSTSTKPYTLYPASNAVVTNWLTGILDSASLYDNLNPHRLVGFIPSHIQEDPANEITSTFIDMVGHFFDIQYQYVDQFTNIYDRHQSLTEGFAKDLVHYVAESLGTDFDNGQSFDDLWSYTLGYNISGSFNNGLNLSSEDRTREVWKRIINNLPYLLKTRGTERGLRALINSFGIPSTILRIREFGGPEPDFDTQSTYNVDRFYYALNVGKGNTTTQPPHIIAQWSGSDGTANGRYSPDGIELRFKAAPFSGSVNRMNLISWYSQSFGPRTYAGVGATLDVGRDSGGDYLAFTGPIVLTTISQTRPLKLYVPSSSYNQALFDGKWVTAYLTYTTASFSTGGTPTTSSFSMSFDLYAGVKSNYSDTPLIYSASITYSGSNADQSGTSGYTDYRTSNWGPWNPSIVSTNAYKTIVIGSSSKAFAYTDVTASFSGSIQELRYWGERGYINSSANRIFTASLLVTSSGAIENSPFYAHVISPTTIVGPNFENPNYTGATSSFNSLKYRLTLGTDNNKIDLYATISLSGSQPNQNIPWIQPTLCSVFSSNTSSHWSPVTETNYMPWPDLGGNRQISNKIRVDELYTPSTELFWNRMTEKSLQDSQPTDSPKLGVYFSTADQVNEDIAEQFGGLHLDDYIGGYGSIYSSSYDDLEQIQRAYFRKYGWNPSSSFGTTSPRFDSATYIRLIANFDGALFNLIKKFVPHRANLQTGLVIEPHILHRPKVGYRKPTWSDETYETTINIPDQTQTPGGSVQDAAGGGEADYCWDGEIARPYVTPVGDYPDQTSVNLNTEVTVTLVGAQNEYNNKGINEQLVQADSLYSTVGVDYTSYGREKILGSQYDFYTWYRTGSGATDWRYDRANSRDQWDPIGISILNSRKSENYLDISGVDAFKASGSFPNVSTLSYVNPQYVNNANGTNGALAGVLGLRAYSISASGEVGSIGNVATDQYFRIDSSDYLLYRVGQITSVSPIATGSVWLTAFPTKANSIDYSTVNFTYGGFNANNVATMSVWLGSSGSSTNPNFTASFNTTTTNFFNQTLIGTPANSDLYIETRVSASGAGGVGGIIFDNFVVRHYRYAQVQDYQCGDNASYGQRMQKYDGSKLTSNDWNEDSPDTIDGGPVISIIEGPGVEIAVNPNPIGTFTFR